MGLRVIQVITFLEMKSVNGPLLYVGARLHNVYKCYSQLSFQGDWSALQVFALLDTHAKYRKDANCLPIAEYFFSLSARLRVMIDTEGRLSLVQHSADGGSSNRCKGAASHLIWFGCILSHIPVGRNGVFTCSIEGYTFFRFAQNCLGGRVSTLWCHAASCLCLLFNTAVHCAMCILMYSRK